jgi:predicted kinase
MIERADGAGQFTRVPLRPLGQRGRLQPAATMAAMFVLVAGPPGSGKSTLAASIARALEIPLLVKDDIKEAMMEVLGPPHAVAESRQIGRAAVMAMLSVARACPDAVLDSTFYPYTVEHLRRLRPPLIEIRCICPREVAEARYRARSQTRHARHLDEQRPPEELWNRDHLEPLGLGPLIEVDTSAPVYAPGVVALLLERAKPSRFGTEAEV